MNSNLENLINNILCDLKMHQGHDNLLERYIKIRLQKSLDVYEKELQWDLKKVKKKKVTTIIKKV